MKPLKRILNLVGTLRLKAIPNYGASRGHPWKELALYCHFFQIYRLCSSMLSLTEEIGQGQRLRAKEPSDVSAPEERLQSKTLKWRIREKAAENRKKRLGRNLTIAVAAMTQMFLLRPQQ